MSVRKSYSPEFKAKVVLEILKEEKSISELSSEHGVHPTQLNRWTALAIKELPSLFTDRHNEVAALKADYEKQLQELYAEVGRLTTQLAWLKKKSGY